MDPTHDPQDLLRGEGSHSVEESLCPFGCIFHKGRLVGDCRMPWSHECYCEKKGRICDKEWEVEVPDFRWSCFCETTDDWHPTVDGKVKLTVVKLPTGKVRICIWGGDDFGLERDLEVPFNAAVLEAMLIPVPIAQAWLRAKGYVPA